MKPSELNAIIRNPASTPVEVEKARKDKSDLINRVGADIHRLRLATKGSIEFVAFRNELYSIPEDDREARVKQELAKYNLV